jgi:hypothetical protein
MSLSREARGLVDAARREAGGPTQQQRKRMRRAVMVAVGTGAVAGAAATSGTAAAAITTSSAVGVVAKVGIAAMMVALVGGGVALLSQSDEAPVLAPTAVTPVASAVLVAVASTQAEPLPVPEPIATTSASASVTPAVIAPSSAAHPVDSEKNGGLAEEVELVKAAQNAVAAGNHSEALVSLDRYAARFPKGMLGYEASALRAIALCGVGRKQEGRAIQKAMSESGSPLAARIEAACK